MPARKPPLRNQKATHNCCFCPLLGYPDGCWTTMSSLLTRGGLPATGPKKEPSSGPFGAIHCTHPLAIDNRLTRHASSISKPVHAEYHTMSSSRKVVSCHSSVGLLPARPRRRLPEAEVRHQLLVASPLWVAAERRSGRWRGCPSPPAWRRRRRARVLMLERH